jgi:hypothetical protein
MTRGYSTVHMALALVLSVLAVSDFLQAEYLELVLRPLTEATAGTIVSLLHWIGLVSSGLAASWPVMVFRLWINYRCIRT